MSLPAAPLAELLPDDWSVPPEPVAVGWSGGADSTALLLALQAAGADVRAWHVDHAWRPESAAEGAQLADRARRWGIPFHAVRLDAPSGRNREAEARRARWRQFAIWAEAQQVRKLMLGHHRNDQAETVFMRMLQGAGVAGCRGMHRQRERDHLRVERPLLDVDRAAIESSLRQAGIDWLEDPSNNDLSLQRNHVRCRVFPQMAASGVDPVGLFCRWSAQAGRIAAELESAAETAPLDLGDDAVRISWNDWQASIPPVRARLLQRMTARLFGEGATPGRRHILLAESWTRQGGRGGLDLSGCRLERRRGNLHLKRAGAMLR